MGNAAEVTKEPDSKSRIVTIPGDLKAELARFPALRSLFSSLPCSHRKEYVDWIAGARRPETRKTRIERTLRMLAAYGPAQGGR